MGKARPSSSEIDRFLEEVNRRKQQQARQAAPPPQIQQSAPPPRQKAASVPKAQKVQQRQIIIEEPVMRSSVVQQLPLPIQDFTPRPTTSAYQIEARPPDMPRGAESAPIMHAKALIKSRDGMRAMFVLNEILSPPRSKQPYQRHR